ncbi:MAG TPA: hypothetical protein PLK96_09535 [Bacteroidales bacterium]|jgi:hypothetical protein|nr:hypothetical protein [Bacteroidales bacterium]HQI64721.1 hypothetical protein [Bacteroidales bacterium]
MKVSGLTIVRNAVQFDYPVVEAILSILPLCDEFIVGVGNSQDNTLELVQQIASPKIRIFQSIWDENLRQGGRVLAVETDKAFQQISPDTDWCFYIQADEILHENDLDKVYENMRKNLSDRNVEGLLFRYLHFYGSYDYIGDSRKWYRHEVRIVRNSPKIHSFRDAQGFRWDNRPIKVKDSGGTIFHYGWVRPPEVQAKRQKAFHRFWHDDQWIKTHLTSNDFFDYSQIDSLSLFRGIHPRVMQDRIRSMNWKFDFDPTQKNFGFKAKILYIIEKIFGWRPFEYKNYRLLK